jgi:hypothetical protein
MIDFKPPVLEDIGWLRPILRKTGTIASEFTFGTLFIWKDTFATKIAKYNGFVFACVNKNGFSYKMPFGGGEITKDIIETLIHDAGEREVPFRMYGVSEDDKKRLEDMFPGRFDFVFDRSDSDYVYNAADLAGLSGRKYHGKRNHAAQFRRKYAWEYEDLYDGNLDSCRVIAREWCKKHGCKDENGFESETCALRKALQNFQKLGLAGGLIKVDGQPAAFTIGEEINSGAYLIHFEKGLDGYDGIYAVINNEFVLRHLTGYKYINREEDLGLEGLRRSKLSYHPAFLIKKYSVYIKQSGCEQKND